MKAFMRACGRFLPDARKPFSARPLLPAIPYGPGELSCSRARSSARKLVIPGVQAKISLHPRTPRKESGKLTIVGLWGHFILKPPVERYPEMPETEDLTMSLAGLFGIRTVEHCLCRSSPESSHT
ncbi:MAG: hypothetical protein R3B51_13480 [Thermodesulfobacteriota bacterium]